MSGQKSKLNVSSHAKCQTRLETNVLRGAITAARTLVEEVLAEIKKQEDQHLRTHKDPSRSRSSTAPRGESMG